VSGVYTVLKREREKDGESGSDTEEESSAGRPLSVGDDTQMSWDLAIKKNRFLTAK
jgi:hypothetical protein